LCLISFTVDCTFSLFLSLFFYCYAAHRALHSFPTRRSSDLAALRLVMGSDEVLAAMAQTPLFLSLMCLAYQAVPLADLDRPDTTDRKSTRLNSSHVKISYAVFCLKKKKKKKRDSTLSANTNR